VPYHINVPRNCARISRPADRQQQHRSRGAAHVLEFSEHPAQILREVARVLLPRPMW